MLVKSDSKAVLQRLQSHHIYLNWSLRYTSFSPTTPTSTFSLASRALQPRFQKPKVLASLTSPSCQADVQITPQIPVSALFLGCNIQATQIEMNQSCSLCIYILSAHFPTCREMYTILLPTIFWSRAGITRAMETEGVL